MDDVAAPLTLTETSFPTVDAMREGVGTIRMKLRTARSGHRLRFENRHMPQISVYLVNCLAGPSDGLLVRRQTRDDAQRSIEFEYAFGAAAVPGSRASWFLVPYWPFAFGLLLVARMAVLLYRARHEKEERHGEDCRLPLRSGGARA